MTGDSGVAMTPGPVVFPLPAAEQLMYVTQGKETFGWSAAAGTEGEFVLSRYGWNGRASPVATWPLDQQGWDAAWKHLATDFPALAESFVKLWTKEAAAREALARREANRLALEAEGQIGELAACVFLGGYGVEAGLRPGDKVDLYFTEAGIWLAKAGGYKPYLHRSYGVSHALTFEGGTVRSGGGYGGGGFGLVGAAEGMAIASLLNSLTTKTAIHTTLRYEAVQAEVFIFTDQAVPRTLEMRFAEVRARIKMSTDQSTAPITAPTTSDFTERLLRLSELLEKGHLTPDEFTAAKTRLLNEA